MPRLPGTGRFAARDPRMDAAAGGVRRLFGPAANPLRHLGALGFLLFWIVAASGIYLYAVLDTSVEGVYQSIEYLSRDQWYFGGIIRSLHRYASDGFLLVMVLHLVRELLHGRLHGFRWFTWVSGVPLLWLSLGAGIVGFWIVWDRLAQFSAIASMEWLDALRVFAEPLTRNFLTPGAVNDRFFSLLVFLHIGLPLLVLLGLWIHIQRISRPDTRPVSPLTWGTLAALVALSVAAPVQSLPAADLATAPGELKLDWFYLAPNALMYQWSAASLWWLAAGVTVVLVTLPWMPRERRQPVAVVDPANCNGCERCVADCPYAAITMQPRLDTRGRRSAPGGGSALVRELRHLRRRLPVLHSVPQHRRAGERNRYASASHRAVAQPAQGAGRAAAGQGQSRRVWVRPCRRRAAVAGTRHGGGEPLVRRSASAFLRRVRAARGSGRRAGHRVPRMRLRFPARRYVDRAALARRARAASAADRLEPAAARGVGGERSRAHRAGTDAVSRAVGSGGCGDAADAERRR